jgi:hypothetical protein
VNPIASALKKAQEPTLAQPEPEQIHPETERSSLRQAVPDTLSGIAAKSRSCRSTCLCGLPLRATLLHDALVSGGL